MTDLIHNLQARIIAFLTAEADAPLNLLARHNCSELSLIVSSWILRDPRVDAIWNAQGKDVRFGGAHDLLLVGSGNEIWALDPTIWQFFPDAESIVLGTFVNIDTALAGLTERYGGVWRIVDEAWEPSAEEIAGWEHIVRGNIQQIANRTV